MLHPVDHTPHCARFDSAAILIVGAGRGGLAMLEVLHNYEWIKLHGIVDIDDQAPGLHLARSIGIPVFTRMEDVVPGFDGDLIIDVTGSAEVHGWLHDQRKRNDIGIVSGKEAKLLYDLVVEQIRDKEKIHVKTVQLELLKTMLDISQQLEKGNGGGNVLTQGLEGSAKLIVSPRALAMECVDGRLETIGGIGVNNAPVHIPPCILEKLTAQVDRQTPDFLVELKEPLKIPGVEIDFQLAVPLFVNGNLRYCLLFQLSSSLQAPIRASLSMLASHLQLALEAESQHQLLKELAYRDPLTCVYNRRYFDERLQQEMERMRRAKQGSLAVMFIDLDHFKQFNDSLGHSEGDRLLKTVAQSILSKLRTYDVLARYGGDEFVVILLETDTKALTSICKRILSSIDDLQSNTDPGRIDGAGRLGLSIGVATLSAGVDMEAETLLEQADKALYSAKQSGRRQVRIMDAADAEMVPLLI